MKQNSPALLPQGFQDLLPPESDREAYLVRQIGDLFKTFGYRYVKPPLMEFETNFMASAMGYALSDQTFRLMDPESHEMMALRADITPQIVRLAQCRMPDFPRPLRLFYAADSLRVRGEEIRTARQFTQIGCECIGLDDIEVDLEICVLAILSLKALELGDITIDFNLPKLVPSLLRAHEIAEDTKMDVKKALQQKDRAFLKALPQENGNTFVAVLESAGPLEKGLEKLTALEGLPDSEKSRIRHLSGLSKKLQTVLGELKVDNVNLTLDCADIRGFDYHTGFGFTLFSKQIQAELGRGGRYLARFDHNPDLAHSSGLSAHEVKESEKACGFSLYTDNLRQSVKRQGRPERLAVPMEMSWKDISAYQTRGRVIVRLHLKNLSDADLQKMGVTHKLSGNKILPLPSG